MLGTATDFLMTRPRHREMLARPLFPHFTDEDTKAQGKMQSPRGQRQSGNVTGTRPSLLVASALRFTAPFPSDAAFLAREKAKADAECYTAMKIAEANKVNAQGRLLKRTYIGV